MSKGAILHTKGAIKRSLARATMAVVANSHSAATVQALLNAARETGTGPSAKEAATKAIAAVVAGLSSKEVRTVDAEPYG